MNLKQLKEECPKLPEDIRAMIQQEVAVQIQKPDRKKGTVKRHSWKKMMAVALAAAMAVGTTAFAGAWIYRWHVKREGKYGLKAGVEAKDFSSASIPEEIPVLSFKAKYLPEGMVKEEGDFNKYY
ncbi:MAG: hypothetical protein Q4D55_12150, partial [Eubacteriales bacterium]|nr:hypothetical protein [Eubacteriales bacterium]